jgi:phosphate starvation-inducible PhoH-like protein
VSKVNQKNQPIKPSVGFKNKKQQLYYNTIMENQITVATGMAGTAKTFIACYAGLSLLASGDVDKIIVTKPSVEVGKTQGYLPGDTEEKMAPFTRSVLDCVSNIIGEAQMNNLYHSKKQIEILPLQHMRGLTLDKCFIIMDEAQNAEYMQMKTILTRLGEDATLVINGDLYQKDLTSESGLAVAVEILEDIDGVGFIEFGIDDVVRSGITKDILIAYHRKEFGEDPK